MRELHVVAVSEDGRSVVLATSRGATRGGFRVAIDERLTSAVRGDAPRPGDAPPVDVTPKEIQARLRAGESVENIAATAGVPLSKIERYAGPVLSERERVLDQARSGYVSRSRLGASALPLGEAVDRHLADTTGVRPETVTWSARREEAGTWVVEVSYVSQARRRTAAWRYDVARREVTATDSASAQLAHVEPGRAARSAGVVVPAPATPAAKRAKPQSRRPASEPTRRTRTSPSARTVAVRPDAARAGAGPADAARVEAADRAAHAAAARAAQDAAAAQTAEADRALAAARAAELASAEHAAAGRRAAQDAADAQARRQAKTEAERASARRAEATAARAAAERKAKADADRKAKAEAARKAKADADRKAKAAAARKAKAEAVRKAEMARKAEAQAAAAEAERLGREAQVVAAAPSGPPTLRVVGGHEEAPRRSAPKAPPAPARTAPARAAGQRASVPGWADVLLSTAPVRSGDADQDQD